MNGWWRGVGAGWCDESLASNGLIEPSEGEDLVVESLEEGRGILVAGDLDWPIRDELRVGEEGIEFRVSCNLNENELKMASPSRSRKRSA